MMKIKVTETKNNNNRVRVLDYVVKVQGKV